MPDFVELPDDAARAQLAEDDHDLLTFGEVGERLRLEIAYAEAGLETATSAGDEAGIAKARARLTGLRDAARRNAAQPINDANFEKFFGYPGKARRYLDSPGSDG